MRMVEEARDEAAAERGDLVKMIYSGGHLVFTTKYAMESAVEKAEKDAADAESARRTAMVDSVVNGAHPCIVSRKDHDELIPTRSSSLL